MLHIALLAAAVAPPLSSDVEISPAVRQIAIAAPNGFGPDAERQLADLAMKGDRSAAALLGELLQMPERAGGADHAGACTYSERAGTHASALHNAATCYYKGEGRPRDLARARTLYQQGADRGFAKAACALGNMLVEGQGGPRDTARGLDLCRAAADTGLADAQADYGGYLLTARHMPKDAVKARAYLVGAADQGHANAAFILGQIYWNGDGIARDVPQAAIHWIKAYERGRVDAAALIGNAALSLIVEAARAKKPVATVVIDQAKRWLDIAKTVDPDPESRAKAAEQRRLLDQLLDGK